MMDMRDLPITGGYLCLCDRYHLKDVIVGKIYFLLVRIKIKHMEIAIIKRETTGSGPNIFNENETIAKYEIMDGAPVRGALLLASVEVFIWSTTALMHLLLRVAKSVRSTSRSTAYSTAC